MRLSRGLSSIAPSRAGLTLVAAYLLLAGFVWYEALSCTGWVCDLAALPGILPLGFPIAWLTGWTSHLREWYFIASTVLANSVFYYWLGHLLGGLVNRLRRLHSATRHKNFS